VIFAPSEDQEALVASATALTSTHFGSPASRRDIPAHVSAAELAPFARNGFAGIALDAGEGGQGGSLLDAVLVIEAVSRLNPIAGDAIQALNFGAIQQLAHLGSAELKMRYLRPCLEGKLLTAIAMTESEAGSAVSSLKSTARFDGANVILNGAKIFTTHGADADFMVVWVRFSEERSALGAVVVERGTAGFTIDASHHFMSGDPYGMLYLEECSVPRSNVLVDHDGLRSMLTVFNIERLGNAARSLALGQAAFDLACEHVQSRRQFGARLADFQGLRWRLAECAVKLESARLLLYKAAVRSDSGLPSATDTAMAKLSCNRAGYETADCALQLFGALGYDDDSVVSYLFHRTRGWMIAGGTVEQMLNRIAAGFLPPDSEAAPRRGSVAKAAR
jgi:alkylation response protein AidB-like acyl-CoA dehydrogenase